jgi:hypothetical protein
MSSDNFEENLAIGIAGEDIVYNYLIRNNSFVEDCRNQKHDKNHGPRMVGTDGILIQPDFAVYNKNPVKGKFAVDVKVKSKTYDYNDKKCFTVDTKFSDYKRIVQLKSLDFLAIIFVFEDKLYFYKDTEICGTKMFDNKWGKGESPLFEFDPKKQVY